MANEHSRRYFSEAADLALLVDSAAVDAIAHGLAETRERGRRLFIVGVGGKVRSET